MTSTDTLKHNYSNMENLIGKSVTIDNFLTTDPKNKQGQTGIIQNMEIYDEENADFDILFDDGVVGKYQFGTFNY